MKGIDDLKDLRKEFTVRHNVCGSDAGIGIDGDCYGLDWTYIRCEKCKVDSRI